ncbi:Indole-3-glycerol phosphate synthase [subsurface metagenome]
MILDEIVAAKKNELERRKQKVPLSFLSSKIPGLPSTRNFEDVLTEPGIALIAEVKKASPSAGIIRQEFNPLKIAKIYEENNVSAISVLTEEKYFLGNLNLLSRIKKITKIPILQKDFILEKYQIYEARFYGADGILLIAAILSEKKIKDFLGLVHQLGMSAILEVHNDEDLKKVLITEAKIIGINNRNLKTLKVDLGTTLKLREKIPSGKIVVSESGIKDYEDIQLLKKCGIDAILVGESLLQSKNIGKKIRELIGEEND